MTEHVFEKQEFRDAVEWMVDGHTPAGQTLTAGAAPFAGVFDNTGIFQDLWLSGNFPSLTTVRSWSGNINDAFTGLLGRTTDAVSTMPIPSTCRCATPTSICTRTLFETYLDDEIAFWGSSAASTTYTPTVVADMVQKLTGWKTNLNTVISLPVARMTP